MYDCNLIKSRAQKMQEFMLPSLESTYPSTQMSLAPGMLEFPMPIFPGVPSSPPTPAPPETPSTPAMPGIPGISPVPAGPGAPGTPVAPSLPPAPPESERTAPISPLLPRTLPTSPSIAVPANPLLPEAYSTTLDYESLQYLNGYLRTQIGSYVEVEFLVGSTNISSRFGILLGVGLNYILIKDLSTGDVTACDFYNIKFFRTHANYVPSRSK